MADSTSPPWSPNEIRENASKELSLENDAKLLKFMENISNNIIDRATATNSNVDALVSNLNRTSVALDNVANRLSSLSHYKFVENRVYDDDDDEKRTVKPDLTAKKQTNVYNPVETLNTIIKNNMKMLNSCYEKVTVDLADSDDESDQVKSIVYRPKNPFETRPIPFLIGSKDWKDKWHIGLYDSDESFSENEEFSDASESVSLPSNGPACSESGSSAWSLNRNSKRYQSKINQDYSISSDDEDISSPSKTSSESKKESQIVIPTSIPIPEQRYYVHPANGRDKGLFDESSDSDSEYKSSYNTKRGIPEKGVQVLPSKPDKNISNIFNNEPPELDVIENSKPPSQLFFDSDEDEPIVDKKPVQSNTYNSIEHQKEKPSSIVPKKTINLFDDDVYNAFLEELDQKKAVKISKEPTKKINLFDDDDDDGDDNEDAHENNNQVHQNINNNKIVRESNEKDIISRAGSSFTNQNNIPTIGLFDDEDDLFANTSTNKSNINSKSKLFKITNLFDDEPPDDNFEDLFGSSRNSNSDLLSKNESAANKTFSNIFDSDNNRNIKQQEVPILNSQANAQMPDKIYNINIDKNNRDVNKTPDDKSPELEIDKNVLVQKKNTNIFFDDTIEDDDDFFEKIRKNRVDNKTAAGTVGNLSFDISNSETKRNLFDDVESEDESSMKNTVNPGSYTPELEETNNNNPVTLEGELNKIEKTSYDGQEKYTVVEKIKNEAVDVQFFNSEPPEEVDELFGSLSNTKAFENNDSTIRTENAIVPDENLESLKKSSFLFSDIDANEDELFSSSNKLNNETDIVPSNAIETTENESKEIREEIDPNSNDQKTDMSAQNSVFLPPEKLFNDEHPADDSFVQTTENVEESSTKKDERENEVEIIEAEDVKAINLPTTTSLFSTSLFDDSPPEDCDIFTSPVRSYQNEPETEIFGNSSENVYPSSLQPATPSNYIAAIFQDTIPPEDDEIDNNTTKPTIKSIFYDDFSETITSPNVTSNTSFLFNDEPPPDDSNDISTNEIPNNEIFDDLKLPTVPQPDLTIKADKTSLPFSDEKKTLSVSDLIKKASVSNITPIIEKSEPVTPPKKLTPSNLKINIAALLPGAKRPNYSPEKDDSTDGQFSSKLPEQTYPVEEEKPTVLPKTENVSEPYDSKRLTSFNKNRAKILTKRRPSTRKGRQENYAKSLVVNDSSSSETIDSVDKPNSIPSLPNLIQSKVVNIQQPKNLIASNFKATKGFNTIDLNFPTSKNRIIEANTTSKSLEQQSSKINHQLPVSILKDEISNKDDWLVNATSKIESAIQKPPQPQTQEIKKPADISFFDDDEDDQDDLFATSFVAPKRNIPNIKKDIESVQPITIKKTSTPIENDQEIFKKIKIYKKQPIKSVNQQQPSVQDTSNMLPDKKQQPPMPNIKKSTGIFSSDEEDDDLFGGGTAVGPKIGATEKLSNISKSVNKKVLNTSSTKTSLFDDVDDDDDLFGGNNNAHTSNKAQLINKTNQNRGAVPKPIDKKPKAEQQIHTKTTGYNPLADLLDK